jgi:putative transposase
MPLPSQDLRTFFITSVTANRRSLFQVDQNALLFPDVLASNRAKGRLACHAFVLMPDHVHLILRPAPDVSLEQAMQFLKGGFSFQLKSHGDIWERSFKEHRIKDCQGYAPHQNYVEQNPIRAHLAFTPAEYAYSSASHPTSSMPPPPISPKIRSVTAPRVERGASAPRTNFTGEVSVFGREPELQPSNDCTSQRSVSGGSISLHPQDPDSIPCDAKKVHDMIG